MTTAILGDSMIRQIRSFEMAKSIGKSSRVVVKSFSGATTDNMKHYIIPIKEMSPERTTFEH